MSDAHLALGVNVSHDRAAVLVQNGEVVAGIAEERLDRTKHSIVAGPDGSFLTQLPQRAIAYCLDAVGASLADVDDLVVSGSVVYHPQRRLRNVTLEDIAPQLPRVPPKKITILGHHIAHAFSTFLASPYNEAAVLVADGAGNIAHRRKAGWLVMPDVEHTSAYLGGQAGLQEVWKVCGGKHAMNSLGALYHLITLFAGFAPFEEGKIMGLAPYGSERLAQAFARVVALETTGYSVRREFQPFDLRGRLFHRAFLNRFGKPRAVGEPLRESDRDLARAVQETLEEAMIGLACRLHRQTRSRNLCLAGGVGLNCVANRRILDETGFDNCFFVPCAGDDGTALGAALWAWIGKRGGDRRYRMEHPFLGRSYSNERIENALNPYRSLLKARRVTNVGRKAARMLADGRIVGWFQGGAEFGPRALGHRSILADPRRPDAKDRLNQKVKHREDFRPFAPAVLENRAQEFFDLSGPSPFMLQVGRVKNPERLPAVTHVDGSARVQTVSDRVENRRFWDTLAAFEEVGGVPVLLNTSFNVAGEPIVESPTDAIECLLNSQLDALFLEDYRITKKHPEMVERIAVLQARANRDKKTIDSYETELTSIRRSRGWRLIGWINRWLRPWRKSTRPDIL